MDCGCCLFWVVVDEDVECVWDVVVGVEVGDVIFGEEYWDVVVGGYGCGYYFDYVVCCW